MYNGNDLSSIGIKAVRNSIEHWNLKVGNSDPKVTWAVKKQFGAYNPDLKKCYPCLNVTFVTFE